MPRVTLDHCVIHVSDWPRSNAFYRDVLGAEIIPHTGGYVYRFEQGQLSVHGPGAVRMPEAATPASPGAGDLCFEWPGPIDEARAHLGRCGVQIELGPVQRFGQRGSGTSIYFRDPDGALLEFISYADSPPGHR